MGVSGPVAGPVWEIRENGMESKVFLMSKSTPGTIFVAIGPLVPQKGDLALNWEHIHSCLDIKGIDIKGRWEILEQLSR